MLSRCHIVLRVRDLLFYIHRLTRNEIIADGDYRRRRKNPSCFFCTLYRATWSLLALYVSTYSLFHNWVVRRHILYHNSEYRTYLYNRWGLLTQIIPIARFSVWSWERHYVCFISKLSISPHEINAFALILVKSIDKAQKAYTFINIACLTRKCCAMLQIYDRIDCSLEQYRYFHFKLMLF